MVPQPPANGAEKLSRDVPAAGEGGPPELDVSHSLKTVEERRVRIHAHGTRGAGGVS